MGDLLQHSVHSLQKVARLPSKDRSEVLIFLKKKVCKCHGKDRVNKAVSVVNQGSSKEILSSTSVNNDWKNWVVMNGNEQVTVVDVWGIGKAIEGQVQW